MPDSDINGLDIMPPRRSLAEHCSRAFSLQVAIHQIISPSAHGWTVMLFILRAGLLAFVFSCIHSYNRIVTLAAPVSITSDNVGSYGKMVPLSQRPFANPDIVHLSGRSGYLVARRDLGFDTSHSRPQVVVRRSIFTEIGNGIKSASLVYTSTLIQFVC
jgi:hypothetical protein